MRTVGFLAKKAIKKWRPADLIGSSFQLRRAQKKKPGKEKKGGGS